MLVEELRMHQEEVRVQQEQLLATRDVLEATRDRYASLFHDAPVGYVSLDDDGVMLDVNGAAAALLGTAAGRLIGTPLLTRVLQADRARFLAHLARARGGARDVRSEIAFTGHAGRPVVVDVVTQPAAAGRLRVHHTALLDLTSHRAAMAKERRAQAACTLLEHEEARRRTRAGASERSGAAHAAAVAAELTPVGLRLATSLQRETSTATRQALLAMQRHVRAACSHLLALVQDAPDDPDRAAAYRGGAAGLPDAGTPRDAPPARPAGTRPALPRGLRVLIAGARPATAEALGDLLQTAGASVSVAGSVAGALEVGRDADVVIAALDLPDGHGADILDHLRRDHPVVGIALADPTVAADPRHAQESAFGARLVDPFGADEVIAAVCRAAAEVGSAPAPTRG